MLDAALSALAGFLDPSLLLFLLLGVLAGLVIGVIPGLGGTAAVALLLPFIFTLEPEQAFALMIGSVAVVHTSDTITAVLIGVPGSASTTTILMDAHTMAKQGMAARALSIAFLSSMAGGLLGAIGLTLSIPVARPLVLLFASPELFMLTVLGVTLTALLSRGNMVKGLVAGTIGLLLGLIGTAPAVADRRYTFGSLVLLDGLDLVAVALGIFGLAEIAHLVAKRTSIASNIVVGSGWRQGASDFYRYKFDVVRGALVGMWAGVLPGLGATAGTWMAYGQTVATAKPEEKKKFGKGHPRGIVAPESANNSVEAGDLLPTLLFGIPGGAPAAILLGALLFYGIQPGPRIVTDNLDILYTIIYAFAAASVLGAALCFFLTKPLAKFSTVPFPILAPGLIVIMLMAGYQRGEAIADLLVMVALGVLGWSMKNTGYPRAPLLIGFVLALPLERYYYLTDSIFEPSEWLTRPFVLGMGAILFAPLVLAVIRRLRGKERPAEIPDDESEELYEHTLWPLSFATVALVTFVGAFILAQDFQPRAQLVPILVCTFGILLSAAVVVREVRKLFKGRERGRALDEGVRTTLRSFGWILCFIVLAYFLGMVVGTMIFVPVFLWLVAGMRLRGVVAYTSGLVTVLLVLAVYAGVALPSGLYGELFIRF